MHSLKLAIQSVLLIAPLVFAGSVHMMTVKTNILAPLNVPISKQLFGENKTYRGLIVMPILTAVGMFVATCISKLLPLSLQLPIDLLQASLLGALLGFSYMLFELPNSFLKRRLGIPPGKSAKKYTLVFRLIDRLDSTIGCLIVFYLFFNMSWEGLLVLFIMGILVHAVTTRLLYLLNIRKEPW